MVFANKQDWPEKLDINKLVTRQSDIDKITNGEKTTERRNDRYADVGDKIVLDGHVFIIEDIYPQQLKDVTEQDAKQEGYNSLEDFKETLTSIHEAVVWNPELFVWVHEFREE